MSYGYLRDPLFLLCFVGYLTNRLLLKQIWPTGFLHTHFNDLICIPLLVPVIVWGMRILRLRTHDQPPTRLEIVIPIVVWSVMFEIVLPGDAFWSNYAVADPLDVFYYCLGGLLASVFWRWRYGVNPNVANGRG